MTTDTTTDTATDCAARLHSLDRLVGTWAVSGPDGLTGQVSYAWADGGAWLVQQVDLGHGEEHDRGVEYIGWDPDRGELRSHFFGSRGEHLEYTYRLEGDLLTIWFGDPSSPARFEGRFTPDGRSNTGAWQWPGGGYASTMTRTDRPAPTDPHRPTRTDRSRAIRRGGVVAAAATWQAGPTRPTKGAGWTSRSP